MDMREVIAVDLARTFECAVPRGSLQWLRLLGKALVTTKGLAIVGFRISHRVGQKSAFGGALVKQITHVLTGADIGYGASIGPGLRILHPTGIVIADSAVIGSRSTIHPCTIGRSPEGSPVIGDDVQIAPGARVLGNVRVDNGCHIAANAVMTRSIPGERITLAGVPARPIER